MHGVSPYPPAPTHPSNARAAAPRPSCTVCATVPTAPLAHPRAFIGVGGQNACARSPPRRPRAPPRGHRGARAAFAVMGPAPGDPAARAATATRRRARASRMRLDGSRSPAHSRRRARPLRSYLSAALTGRGRAGAARGHYTCGAGPASAGARALAFAPHRARGRIRPGSTKHERPFPPLFPPPPGRTRGRAHSLARSRRCGRSGGRCGAAAARARSGSAEPRYQFFFFSKISSPTD